MTLKLNGSSSGSVSIDAPASTTSGADITFALPVADGSSGQALTTNASGQLAFSTIPSAYAGVATIRAWALFDGDGDVNATLTGGNITSITDNGTGQYTITFDTDFSDANYMMAGNQATNGFVGFYSEATHLAGSCKIATLTDGGGYNDPHTLSVGFWK